MDILASFSSSRGVVFEQEGYQMSKGLRKKGLQIERERKKETILQTGDAFRHLKALFSHWALGPHFDVF